eukprot:TRINITY_DN3745_c0_g1_i3.p1 TRINITY_DN3745_c0_g1~~TRINITY_DN3745_c0_g1_i3.p1  ORF type:complete len:199 (+),score=24.51 TRINITY_DN3745_c0_g1_i3:359-955(+)
MRYFNIIVVNTLLQTFQWVGWWDVLTEYLWPFPEINWARDIVFICLGLFLITLSTLFFGLETITDDMQEAWEKGLPTSFDWGRKLRNYCKKLLNFLGFLLAWVGCWDIFDVYSFSDTIYRDVVFLVVPLVVGFVTEEILSTESLYYIYCKIKLHQSRSETEKIQQHQHQQREKYRQQYSDSENYYDNNNAEEDNKYSV